MAYITVKHATLVVTFVVIFARDGPERRYALMDLKDVQDNWNRFGETDPFWAVLAWPGMEEGRWDPDAFFATGQEEIDAVMDYVDALGLDLIRGAALDFGWGVGRLTQALAHHFDEVHGVDISETMIDIARKFNQHGDRCQYHLNLSDDLALFDDNAFDFLYSNITLQHMPPRFARGYILEFLRVLKPGGLAIFQIPSRPRSVIQRLLQPVKPTAFWRWYQKMRYGNEPVMNMYGIPHPEVAKLLAQHRGRLVDVQADESADAAWESFRYAAQKLG
jgi:SAM-dependent methyltransferase